MKFRFKLFAQFLAVGFLISGCQHKADVLPAYDFQKPLADDSIYQVSSKWTNSLSEKFELKQLRGSPVAISMIYMTCKYACPMTVSNMKDLQNMLTPQHQQEVKFVLVSFDPKRDTPEAMQAYAQKMHLDPKKWIFLTSQREEDLRELASLIDFKYKKLPNGEYEHSFGIQVLDRDGRMVKSSIGSDMNIDELAKSLEASLFKTDSK